MQELKRQVEELQRANAALLEAQAASQRAHERELREAAERVRAASIVDAALRSVPVAVALIDRDLRYIKVNQACSVMTATPVDQHAGRTLREVNPLLSRDLEAAMRQVLATGEPHLNLRIVRATPHAPGGSIEIVLHITPFYDADGAIAGICSTATDLTEWKALQERFFQAQKLETVGRLAAGIAHDFNNLLNVIASSCDLLLLEDDPGPHWRPEIEEVRNVAMRAAKLASRMLGTVRSRAAVANVIDLAPLLADARVMLDHAVRGRGRLTVGAAEGPALVVADPTQIEQVLMNLVINAVDAMPGGGEVSVRMRPRLLDRPLVSRTGELPPGPYVELAVSDIGTGMDAATLSRLFEPFFTTKPRGKGTGLGLATVFGIVHQLGGGIEVESTVGRGTTFRVLLRRAEGERPGSARAAAPATRATLPRGSETLLVVEDEDAIRESTARIFQRQGYRVLEAHHGGEALRIASEEPRIDLVVSDLHMPGVGGHELARRLDALGRRIPMLFISGSRGEGEATLPGRPAARDRFIGKPFEAEVLLRTVQEMLREREPPA